MSVNRIVVAALLLGSVGLAGCQSTAKSLGMSKVTPDEFRIVTKAPLIVPPDYSLRPPAPGEPRPQELQPESASRNAILEQREGEMRSNGEKLFVAQAGAERADPLIRYVVDDEFGDIAHKEKGFADKVMFWKKGDSSSEAEAATAEAAAAEKARLASLTGDKPVLIKRTGNKLKLPGL